MVPENSVTLSFAVHDSEGAQIAQTAINVQAHRPNAINREVQHLLAVISAIPARVAHLDDFPAPSDRDYSALRFTLDDLATGEYHNRVNADELWLEIQNGFLSMRLSFAEAAAIFDRERSASDEELRLMLHLDKMEKFNYGTFLLVKIEDLLCRLLFEYFDATLVEVDQSKPEWDKQLTWGRLKEGLNAKNSRKLQGMSAEGYDALMSAIRSFKGTEEVRRFVKYRDEFSHRVAPSVDYPDLYAATESRVSTELAPGVLQQPIGAVLTKPEYTFVELYKLARGVYVHFNRVIDEVHRVLELEFGEPQRV